MQLGNINNSPNFSGILIKPNEVNDLKNAISTIGQKTSPQFKKDIYAVLEEIDKKSTELGKDCILTGFSPDCHNPSVAIVLDSTDNYIEGELSSVQDYSKNLSEFCFNNANRPPKTPGALPKLLEKFKQQALSALEKPNTRDGDKKVLDNYVTFDQFKSQDIPTPKPRKYL